MKFKTFTDALNYLLNQLDQRKLNQIIQVLYNAGIHDKNIFLIGNGGSALNASHLSVDISRIVVNHNKGQRVKAFSLTDNIAFMTANSNDYGFDKVFSAQLSSFAKNEDVLLAISCSGNSANIIDAVGFAKTRQMEVLSFTGFDGGKLKMISDIDLNIPYHDFGMVESIHSAIFHYIAKELSDKFNN